MDSLIYESPNSARLLFRSKPVPNSRQDKILGALLGAAIGDVVGQSICGKSKEEIVSLFGDQGVSAPPHDSLVSHNFQLMLFAIDALMSATRKNRKLSIIEISKCLIECAVEWQFVINNPRIFHNYKLDQIGPNTCTDFMKNHPMWKIKRFGLNNSTSDKTTYINPLILALMLFTNERTTSEVSRELFKKFGFPKVNVDIKNFSKIFIEELDYSKIIQNNGINFMMFQINDSINPQLEGIVRGFEHGAKYGIKGFKNIWYLRLDAMSLIEQMGWLVGRNINFR